MMRIFRRSILLTATAIFILSVFVSAAVPYASAKAVKSPDTEMEQQTKQWLYYRGMWGCLHGGFNANLTRSEVESGKWDPENDKKGFGYFAPDMDPEDKDNDGTVDCDDGSIFARAPGVFGFESQLELFCAIDAKLDKYNDNGSKDIISPKGGPCLTAKEFNISREESGIVSKALTAVLTDKMGDKRPRFQFRDNPDYNAMYYWIGKRSLEVFCGNGTSLEDGITDLNNDENAVRVRTVDVSTGAPKETQTYALDGRKDYQDIDDVYYPHGGHSEDAEEKNCGDLATLTRNHAGHFSDYIIDRLNITAADYFKDSFSAGDELRKSICGDSPPASGDIPGPEQKRYASCITGISNRFNAIVDTCAASSELNISMDYASRIEILRKCIKRDLPPEYQVDFGKIADPAIEERVEEVADESTTSCTVEGIGWIICPVINFMADLNDQALGFLGDEFLGISPGFFEEGSASEASWKSFRDIANVAFVVVFLLIIYSQITGGGFTNYGIKKLLPKIIIAAILVNMSFILCQIAIDLSNIIGNSVAAFTNTIPATSADQTAHATSTWKTVSGNVLAATGGIVLALVLLSVVGPAALLALALVVLILIARKALIILLVVISPLAFVAYLLPNTEQYFKKWWKIFSTLLILYPIIGLIFGASQLAAKVIVATGSDADGPESWMIQLTALGVMAIPLFAIPFVLKGVTSSMGSIGAKLSGWQDKATGVAGKGAKDRLKRRGENIEARMASSGNGVARFAGGYRSRRAFGRKSLETDTARRQEEALSEHVIDNSRYNTRQQATAYQAVDKAWDDEVKAHQALYSSKSTDEKTLLDNMNDSKLTQQQRAAAAGMLMKGSRRGQNSAIRSAVALAQSDPDNVGGIQKQMNGDMGSRIPMGLGAGARAELARGKLGVNPTPDEDKPPGTDSKYSFDDEIANRAVAKVSAAGIPDLDPDDLQEILQAAQAGRIQGDDLKTLHTNIATAESDDRINNRINDSARAYLDQISAVTPKEAQDAAAKTYGDNI